MEYVVQLFILLVVFPSLLGFIFSLPASNPALRRRARQKPSARRITMVGLSLACFLTVYPIIIGALTAWLTNDYVSGSSFHHPEVGANSSAISREIWLRLIIPASTLDGRCYQADEKICGLADELLVGQFAEVYGGTQYRDLAVHTAVVVVRGFSIIGLISALFCALFVWRFTRPRLQTANAVRVSDGVNRSDEELIWPAGLEPGRKSDQSPTQPEREDR